MLHVLLKLEKRRGKVNKRAQKENERTKVFNLMFTYYS